MNEQQNKNKGDLLRIPSSLLDEDDEDIEIISNRRELKKDLNLYVGIYYDEKVHKMPRQYDFSGTYKGIVRVGYNKKTKSLRFYPKKEGLATLFVRNIKNKKLVYEFHINVVQTSITKVLKEIKELLKDIDGIYLKVINNKVIVDGQIFLPKDMSRIHTVVKQYRGMARSLVTLSSLAQVKIAQHIERAINNPNIQVRNINGKFVLEGFASSNEEISRAEIIAKTYVPDVVVDEAVQDKKVLERKVSIIINLIKKKVTPKKEEPKKTIQLVVHFVELKKDYSKMFRFQWTPDIADGSSINFSTGGNRVGGALTTLTGTVRNLFPKLNWAKEHGHARVLRSSTIIVQDGQEGVLDSIEKIPYRSSPEATSFVNSGIKTKITPQIVNTQSDSIRLNMFFSISALLGQTAAGPMISQHQIQTTIILRSRRSAAIGGLITNDSGTAYNKLPRGASKNPLISLYNSKDFRRNQSQFVVFITPRIQHSASDGSERIKRKFRLD